MEYSGRSSSSESFCMLYWTAVPWSSNSAVCMRVRKRISWGSCKPGYPSSLTSSTDGPIASWIFLSSSCWASATAFMRSARCPWPVAATFRCCRANLRSWLENKPMRWVPEADRESASSLPRPRCAATKSTFISFWRCLRSIGLESASSTWLT